MLNINLTSWPDRWKKISDQLNAVGITNYERFNAVCPTVNNQINNNDAINFVNGICRDKDLFSGFTIDSYRNLNFDYIKTLDSASFLGFMKGAVGARYLLIRMRINK